MKFDVTFFSPYTQSSFLLYIITDVITIHPSMLSGICELSSNPPCCCYSYIQLITKSFRLSWNLLIRTQCHSCNFLLGLFSFHCQTLFILTHFILRCQNECFLPYLKSSKVFLSPLVLNFHSATKCPPSHLLFLPPVDPSIINCLLLYCLAVFAHPVPPTVKHPSLLI